MAANYRKLVDGLNLVPKASSTNSSLGDLEVLSSTNKIMFHNGTTNASLLTADSVDTLTNKTIAAGSNTITGLTNTNLSGSAGITGANIATNTIANSNLAQMAQHTFKGNNTGATANAIDLTATQLTAELNLFTSSLKGLVPSSGGGTANFLRADGTFAAPPNSGGTVTTVGTFDSQTASANALVISGVNIYAQSASSTNPGMVNTASQSFNGLKTFNNNINTTSISSIGSGLTLLPAGSENLTLQTGGSGRLRLRGATGIEMEQNSAPIAPASGYNSLYFKSNNLLYTQTSAGAESLVGSGGGSGGINFITLDTSFQPTVSDNFNAENGLGSWIAQQVATTNTTGSPTITLSRTTTGGEVLDGAASFKVVKGASNLQNQGISATANIPLGYRGQVASFKMPFKVISGSLVSGDLKVYAYDVTNSQFITVTNGDVVSNGIIQGTLLISSTTAQMKFGLYFASTSAVAVTFSIDDITFGPQQVVFGPSMSDEVNETSAFSFNNLTVTGTKIFTRQVGNKLNVRGTMVINTTAGAGGEIVLPSKYTIDSTKQPSGTYAKVGILTRQSGVSGPQAVLSQNYGAVVFFDGTNYDRLFIAVTTSSSTNYDKNNTNSFLNNGETVDFQFEIPVSGFSTNVVQQNASTFEISNYLANGTRVTGTAPTKLGEYRSYLRVGSTQSYTETNGAPATAPSTTNGIRIYTASTYAASDANNNPSKYDIFVGVGKIVSPAFYGSAGRTGDIDVTPITLGSAYSIGVRKSYDPTTGILTVASNTIAGNSNLFIGSNTDSTSVPLDCYFDLIVSEKVVPVQITGGKSETRVSNFTGYGSTGTTILKYGTVDYDNNNGNYTYTSDAVNGDYFSIKVAGKYSISLTMSTNVNVPVGITRNVASLTTPVYVIGDPTVLNWGNAQAGTAGCVSATKWLDVGDVIRIQADGTGVQSYVCFASISYLGV